MAKNKTQETSKDIQEFINEFVQSETKKAESRELISLFQKVSGFEPKMWGPSIIGFGSYHYKYKSGHEGDAPILGFSPRKAAHSLYVFTGMDEHLPLLENLGKYKMGKACIYVNKIADINLEVLENVMKETMKFIEERYGK
jgi:hypothetical protein